MDHFDEGHVDLLCDVALRGEHELGLDVLECVADELLQVRHSLGIDFQIDDLEQGVVDELDSHIGTPGQQVVDADQVDGGHKQVHLIGGQSLVEGDHQPELALDELVVQQPGQADLQTKELGQLVVAGVGVEGGRLLGFQSVVVADVAGQEVGAGAVLGEH